MFTCWPMDAAAAAYRVLKKKIAYGGCLVIADIILNFNFREGLASEANVPGSPTHVAIPRAGARLRGSACSLAGSRTLPQLHAEC